MAKEQVVHLGDTVKCRVTGLTGQAFGVFDYLYGCRTIQVLSDKLKDGCPNYVNFDEEQLDVVAKAKEKEVDDPPPPPPTRYYGGGGPRPPVTRRAPTPTAADEE